MKTHIGGDKAKLTQLFEQIVYDTAAPYTPAVPHTPVSTKISSLSSDANAVVSQFEEPTVYNNAKGLHTPSHYVRLFVNAFKYDRNTRVF